MKHHYEIMRIMRTKIVDAREMSESTRSMLYVQEALRYRVDDLFSEWHVPLTLSHINQSNHADSFSQQKLDIEKQFQNFAYGMVIYSLHLPFHSIF
jgi:hypothetical protein